MLTLQHVARTADSILNECPVAFRSEPVDLVLVDQVSFSAGSVAEKIGLPFVSICNALLLNQEPSVPPAVSSWSFRDTWWARCRNRAGYAAIKLLAGGVRRVIEARRRDWRLPPRRGLDEHFSPLAQISHQLLNSRGGRWPSAFISRGRSTVWLTANRCRFRSRS